MAHDDHDEHSELGEMDVRVRALQTVLAQKGYVDPAALDVLQRSHPSVSPGGKAST